jgi:hypothetical protein
MLASSYLVSLILTILIEVLVARTFGYRNRYETLAMILVNLITQPAVNYSFLLINTYFNLASLSMQATVLLEIPVALVEWQLLVYALQRNPKSLFVLSLVMNAASSIIGLIFFG